MEEWLSDLVDAESPDEAGLPCEAVPCFGVAIILPIMAELAGSEDWKQALLVGCIAEIGIAGIPTLLRLTEHRSADVRRAACFGLPEALDTGLEIPERAADTLAETLRVLETVPIARRDAELLRLDRRLTEVSEDLQADEEILAALLLRFDDSMMAVRTSAIEALGRLRFDMRHAGAMFSAAVCMLADPDSGVRESAAAYLRYAASRTVTPAREDMIRLRCALADRSRFVRKTAASLLRTLPGGPHAPERMLRPSDREPDEPTAEQVVEAINRALPSTEPQRAEITASVEDLLRSLRSSSAAERVFALKALKEAEIDIALVEDDIVSALYDPDIAVRLAAAEGLERAATPYIAWSLHAAFGDPCQRVARAAQVALTNVVLNMSISDASVA